MSEYTYENYMSIIRAFCGEVLHFTPYQGWHMRHHDPMTQEEFDAKQARLAEIHESEPDQSTWEGMMYEAADLRHELLHQEWGRHQKLSEAMRGE